MTDARLEHIAILLGGPRDGDDSMSVLCIFTKSRRHIITEEPRVDQQKEPTGSRSKSAPSIWVRHADLWNTSTASGRIDMYLSGKLVAGRTSWTFPIVPAQTA